MAADNTAIRVAHQTLVAATVAKINLTGYVGKIVELVHHNDINAVIYFTSAATEALLTTITAVKQDEIEILLPGERLSVPVTKTAQWFAFYSASTPTVSAIATR